MINKKLLWGAGFLLVIVLIILLRRQHKDEIIPVLPTPVPTQAEVVEVKSQTGAIIITPTEEERIVNDSIRILRDKCPIEKEDFVLDFDYKRYTFVVKTDKENSFWMWLDENGYIIPVEDFVIEK